MSAALVVETTRTCRRVPILLFALEELGLEYDLVEREPGYFFARDGVAGPALLDGGERLLGLEEPLRRVGALASTATLAPAEAARAGAVWEIWGRTLVAMRDVVAEGARPAKDALARGLGELEDALGDRDFVLDAPSLVDAPAIALGRVSALGVALPPRLGAYVKRLTARPAWLRASIRLRSLGAERVATARPVGPEDVLELWFGAPATTAAELGAKIRRWFRGGPAFDAEIRARFAPTVRAAQAGAYEDWADDPRGRLALVLVLDQLARHVHRDSKAAYAGDPRAQRLALEGLERGVDAGWSPEERIFLRMPLVHAEDLALQDRAVREADRLVAEAPEALRPLIAMSQEQWQKHRDVIARFGRFPHRNALLGRASTEEERELLARWTDYAPPKDFERLTGAEGAR